MYHNKLECFSSACHFHPSLIFVRQVGAYQSGDLSGKAPNVPWIN